MVGTSRCDVPARVQRAERAAPDVVTPLVAPLNAARTAQRAVPTNGWNPGSLKDEGHRMPVTNVRLCWQRRESSLRIIELNGHKKVLLRRFAVPLATIFTFKIKSQFVRVRIGLRIGRTSPQGNACEFGIV